MTNKRAALWLVLLAAVIAVRIWDPLHRGTAPRGNDGVSAPVKKNETPHAVEALPAPVPAIARIEWPPRGTSKHESGQNAFFTSADVAKSAIKKVRVEPPPGYAYGPPAPPPPPPPPPEPPPPLQVIGTWGTFPNLQVFLSGPQGTILAKQGETVLSEYQVQNITRQQVTLLQASKQRTWNLQIPSAPNAANSLPTR